MKLALVFLLLAHEPAPPPTVPPVAAPAVGPTRAADDDWDDAEPVQAQPVAQAPGSAEAPGAAAVKAPPLLRFIGYFHAAAVHLPIAWLLLLAVVDFFALLRQREEWLKAGAWLLVGTIVTFLGAIATGLMRILDHADDPQALLHRNVMLAAFAMVAVAAGLRWRAGNQLHGAARAAYLGFLIVAVALVIYGGHQGGELVYGEPPGLRKSATP